ncbi:lysophospholipid acyltransferase family protein [Desulfovibrio sp. JC022]|uniref:lysophospholipid acyltransferase family protein n=1 Tax=Desulfovibrio sp. JC022 TaxID=2593642 RepID=UPI0013D42BD5|nr:1-acyl-sn-glycerol-3-phosphate acyltransferase [Desulfovibrio sp. JC022]
MSLIRTLFFYLVFFPATIFFSIVAIIGRNQTSAHWSERNWGKVVTWLCASTDRVDLSALDKNQTYVFMVNHQSFYDIPLLFKHLAPWEFKFVAKKQLFDFPVFGHAMSAGNHISIDRENRRQGMRDIQNAINVADSGLSPLIFPEGTRNPAPEKDGLMEFKTGGMVLALKCKKPIAPVVMYGVNRVCKKHSLWMNPFQEIKIKALPPIDISEYKVRDRVKLKEQLEEVMGAAYAELKNE